MDTTFKNLTPTQKEEILKTVEYFMGVDDISNSKDFLFELQNRFLFSTRKEKSTEKFINHISYHFSILYDFLTELKKSQEINEQVKSQ